MASVPLVNNSWTGLVTTRDAAALCGRSPATVRRWRRNGWIRPTTYAPITNEPLYGPEQLDRMRFFVVAVKADRTARLRGRTETYR